MGKFKDLFCLGALTISVFMYTYKNIQLDNFVNEKNNRIELIPDVYLDSKLTNQFSDEYLDPIKHKLPYYFLGFVKNMDHLNQTIDLVLQDSMVDPSDMKESLLDKLSSRDHVDRFGASYSEDYRQLNNSDAISISLLDKYVNLFDSFSHDDFSKYFREDFSSEAGGIIINDGGLKLIEITSSIISLNYKDSKSMYLNSLSSLFPRLGSFHTHPLQKEVDSLMNYAGPSGDVGTFSLYGAFGFKEPISDLKTLRNQLQFNEFFVNVVITELSKESYNVDAYLRKSLSTYSKSDDLMVIDLGKYDFSKK